VAALRSSDGAILDPDDRLADVVDDREQLAACLSNGGGGGGGGSGSELDEPSLGVPLVLGPRIGLMNLRGDGTSASSNSGSPSPTDFGLHHNHHHHHSYGVVGGNSHPATSRKDIEVTGQEAATGLMVDHLHLQVRRGSEPALNRISTDAPNTTGSSASSTSHHHHHADLPPTTTSNSRDYKVTLHDQTRNLTRRKTNRFGIFPGPKKRKKERKSLGSFFSLFFLNFNNKRDKSLKMFVCV
jgi:hypothetical protein